MVIEVLGLPDARTSALEGAPAEVLSQLGLDDAVTVRQPPPSGDQPPKMCG